MPPGLLLFTTLFLCALGLPPVLAEPIASLIFTLVSPLLRLCAIVFVPLVLPLSYISVAHYVLSPFDAPLLPFFTSITTTYFLLLCVAGLGAWLMSRFRIWTLSKMLTDHFAPRAAAVFPHSLNLTSILVPLVVVDVGVGRKAPKITRTTKFLVVARVPHVHLAKQILTNTTIMIFTTMTMSLTSHFTTRVTRTPAFPIPRRRLILTHCCSK